MIFEDADLPSSVKDVLRWGWSKLQRGSVYYCHEARDLEVVSIFFDHAWWKSTLGVRAPGFVGSGVGLPLGAQGSMLGYCRKIE